MIYFDSKVTLEWTITSIIHPIHFTYLFNVDVLYVTGSEKAAHFMQYFKVKLLVFKGRVA